MIRNGPKIRLNSAPGRRMTSITSLLMKAVVRVQLLSSPRHASAIARTGLLRTFFAVLLHQRGEDFVERWTIFADRAHVDASRLNRLRDAWRGGASIVGGDQHPARRGLLHAADAEQILESSTVERVGRLDFQDFAAERPPP